MKKQVFSITLAVLLLGLMGVLTACGTAEPTPTPTPLPEPVAVPTVEPTPTPDAMAAFESEWNALITRAQAEGELLIPAGSSSSRNNRPVVDAFDKKFGLTSVLMTGGGRVVSNRILAERSRGLYEADVSMMGPGSMERVLDGGALDPIKDTDWLFHPDALDPNVWLFPGVYRDKFGTYNPSYAWRFRTITDIVYNTNAVSPQEVENIQSFSDLLRPEWQGRIVLADVSEARGGGAGDRMRAWMILGEDWLEQMVRMHETVPGDQDRVLADGLARGKWDMIVLSGLSRDVRDMAGVGLPVAIFDGPMKEGKIAEISGALGVFNNATNPNAAKLFLNWWYTREGQTALHELGLGTNAVSLRKDVPQGNIPDELWTQSQAATELIAAGELTLLDRTTEEWHATVTSTLEWIIALYQELGITQ